MLFEDLAGDLRGKAGTGIPDDRKKGQDIDETLRTMVNNHGLGSKKQRSEN